MSYDFDDKLIGPVRIVHVESAQVLRTGNKYTEGSRTPLQETTYNTQGRKTVEVSYNDGGATFVRKVFSYGAKSQLKEVAEYKSDDSLIRRRVYTHNEKNTEELTYKGDGTLNPGKVVNTFDDSGRKTGVTTFSAEGMPFVKAIVTYRDDGKLTEVAVYASSVSGRMLVQSGKGKMVVLSDAIKDEMKRAPAHFDSLLTSRTVFTLDDAGHITEAATYAYDNSLVNRKKYAREFDARGNWIKEAVSSWNIKSSKFEPSYVTYRTITYY